MLGRFRYWLSKKKTSAVLKFWYMVPKSWLYWGVTVAFARATTEKFTSRAPDEVTVFDCMDFLDGR